MKRKEEKFDEGELSLHGKIKSEILGEKYLLFESGINVVFGKNGSGKSTLLKYICGLRKNDEGIMLNDQKIKSKMLSFFFSGDLLGEIEMDIKKNILYYIGYKNMKENIDRYTNLMEKLELFPYESTLLKNASEGMRQKMGIIICLLSTAPIKVLDEPFNYLDDNSCIGLVMFLSEYIKISNDIIIIATNDVSTIRNNSSIIFNEVNYYQL